MRKCGYEVLGQETSFSKLFELEKNWFNNMPSQFTQIMNFKLPIKTRKGFIAVSLIKRIEIIEERIKKEATLIIKILREDSYSNFEKASCLKEKEYKLINFDNKEELLKEIDQIFKDKFSITYDQSFLFSKNETENCNSG